MTGRDLFCSRSAAGEEESLETFIAAYYNPSRPPPPKIYLMNLKSSMNLKNSVDNSPDTAVLDRYFLEKFGFSPEFILPSGLEGEVKKHNAALAMAHQNAKEELRKRIRERGLGPALDELAQILGLKTRPERIEGFDISHLDGKHSAASLVSFRNGIPDRKNYRHYKLRSLQGRIDDYASIREVVHRRYSRLVNEGLDLPDLILIDGGIGQVNAAREILEKLGISSGLAGLAEREEDIWLPGSKSPIKLPRSSEALKILQFVRDETHRFAGRLNQNLRSKEIRFPLLESIEGIGPKRAAAIIKAYEELEKIAAADPEDMAAKCGITPAAALAVRAAINHALKSRKTSSVKKSPSSAAALAAEALTDEAFAAEDAPHYKTETK